MIYLNIYYKSFSLTKNVKVEFSGWSLQFHMYNVPGNSSAPSEGNLELHKL